MTDSRRLTLTDSAIKSAEPGDILRDNVVQGLQVRVRGACKSFYLYYRTKIGVERRPKLGDVGILTISSARDIARDMLTQVAAGRDPQAERKIARGEPTLNELWDRCEKEHWNRGRTWDKEARRLYHAHVAPRIGSQRVRGIRYSDLDRIRVALGASPYEANRTLSVVGKMLALAERFEYRDPGTNPGRSVPRYPELRRRRFAKPDEIAAIGPLLEREAEKHPFGVAFLYLLIFSGARPSEIARAVPAQVEAAGEGGILRIPEGKNGRPRDVYLPPQAMQVLARLPVKRKSLAGPMPREMWGRIRKKAGCPDLWARDWRRTFAVTALAGGQGVGLIGELLGHRSAQTTKIYLGLLEDPALRATSATAGALEGMLKPVDIFG